MGTPNRSAQALGFPAVTGATIGNTTFQNNAAANWWAMGFQPDSARTLSTCRMFVSAVTGTLGASDITADLYDSTGSNGGPGSAIESGKLPSATITASGWYTFTGFTTVLTANQLYWIVIKNVNGTPASNNLTVRYQLGIAYEYTLSNGSSGRYGWPRATSTNSGSTWSNNGPAAMWRIGYADGSYDGMPISNGSGSGGSVYGARESGMKFTTPPNGVLNVQGIAWLPAAKTGTPTGGMRFGLWTGSTPSNLAYTASFPTTMTPAQKWICAYFATTQVIQPGTILRVTMGETTQSDAVGNRFNSAIFTWDTDSNSLALLPFEGTAVQTDFDGTSTWTETSGNIIPFALLLDTAGEFGAGAAGVVVNKQINLWTPDMEF